MDSNVESFESNLDRSEAFYVFISFFKYFLKSFKKDDFEFFLNINYTFGNYYTIYV